MKRFVVLFCLLITLSGLVFSQNQLHCTPTNKALLEAHLKSLDDAQLRDMPIQDIAIEVGTRFLGTTYQAKTLEVPGEEKLVVYLEGLDCTTFLENVVVLSRLVRIDQCEMEDFIIELERIRYRDGELSGYDSRLHYFTEWIANNEEKGIVEDVTEQVGGEVYDKKIDFMSTHRSAYPALADEAFYETIIEVEGELNKKQRHFIPKEKLASLEANIQNGDLIAITTSIGGLDVSHTGMAIRENGRIHLLHASSNSNKVEVSTKPLADYLMGNKRQSGVMVCRLK